MEDDKLESLFANFEPDLPSDVGFMNKLQQNITTVDTIIQEVADIRSRNKKALIIGLFIGFLVGFLFSLLLPYLNATVSNWQLTLPNESLLKIFTNNFTVIAWIVIGTTSVLASINSYEVSLSLLNSKNHLNEKVA